MLTDERALELWSGPGNRPVIGKYKVIAFARAIEAEVRAEAHKKGEIQVESEDRLSATLLNPPCPEDFGIPSAHCQAARDYAEYLCKYRKSQQAQKEFAGLKLK